MSDPHALNLGCGTDIHADADNVDQDHTLSGLDGVVDLNTYPWEVPHPPYAEIRAYHVLEHLSDIARALREIQRLLTPTGRAVVKMPVGQNAIADPDHTHRWIWDTPAYYTGQRHWDADVGLTVVDRDVTLHSHLNGAAKYIQERLIHAYERRHGQGRWMFDVPFTSGEFTVVFRNGR